MRGAYRDREEAGGVLAWLLEGRLDPPGIVAGIPRGGVLIAAPIARRLGWPLTLGFARKLTLPESPELAVGAVDGDGVVTLDPERLAGWKLPHGALDRASERVLAEIRRQQAAFRARPLESFLPEATVVLADDGLATGDTMRAAVVHARRHGARRVVVAVPCASAEAAREFERLADRFVCPWVDDAFLAVGSYYRDFAQVGDDRVREALRHGEAEPSRLTRSTTGMR